MSWLSLYARSCLLYSALPLDMNRANCVQDPVKEHGGAASAELLRILALQSLQLKTSLRLLQIQDDMGSKFAAYARVFVENQLQICKWHQDQFENELALFRCLPICISPLS